MRCSLPAVIVLTAISLEAAEVRRIPPPGVVIPEADRAELQAGVEALGKEIDALRKDLAAKEELLALLPDVQIFHKAVDWALRYDEFMDLKEVPKAKALLAVGMDRAKALHAGEAPWNAQTGLVVRAYRSDIDGSVQPYGLLIPDDFKPGEKTPRRLDFWCHGRGEKLTELAFIDSSMHSKGEFASGFTTPGIVCFLYGRFCNANKFAGERDLFESLDDIIRHYRVGPLVIRGFSMGGAACWQFATHHSEMWAAAAPGAGFAETAEFFKVFAEGKTPPPWWEQVLWRWYDCTTMAANLANTSVVAYSGEIDGQKQAADIMVKYAKQEGLEFPHIIGPQTAHKYHPESKPKIEELIATAVEKGKVRDGLLVEDPPVPMPSRGHFTTYTLIYSSLGPFAGPEIVGMERQWERADIEWDCPADGKQLNFKTRNVSRFYWHPIPAGAELTIDGRQLLSFSASGGDVPPGPFTKIEGHWRQEYASSRLKIPGLCGPIDHAFMSRFVFVRPTGKPLNEAIGRWAKSELDHAIEFWRRVFRGDVPVKDDTAITDDDIKNSNLIVWGDVSSNALLARIMNQAVRSQAKLRGKAGAQGPVRQEVGGLPLKWDEKALEFNGVKYDAVHHMPILIFPNPLNPRGYMRYIVLNSGPTFREEALLNNSDQTPKLPDWAIVNIDTPPDGKWPGQIIDAGFFDEQWALPKN